jgi:hypothetical protein
MIKSFKKFLYENLNMKTLVEQLEDFLVEAWNDNQIQKMAIKLGPDSESLIKQFDALRTANRKEVKGIDIFSFKTADELQKFLDLVPESKAGVEKEIKSTGAEAVFENDVCKVFLIKNKDASCIYGANTKWCITQKEAKHWEDYTDKGISFYFIIRKTPKNDQFDKVAIAKYPDKYSGDIADKLEGMMEAYDAKDKKVNVAQVFKLFNLKADVFKDWEDPDFQYISVGEKKIKYKEVKGIKVYENIDISGQNLTELPQF